MHSMCHSCPTSIGAQATNVILSASVLSRISHILSLVTHARKPWVSALGWRLSTIRAAPTRVGGFRLLAMLVYVADEYSTLETRAGTLKASVVCLYGIVLILGGWVRVGCARLSGVHRGSSLWARSRAVTWRCSAGATSLSDTIIIPVLPLFTTSFLEVYLKYRYDRGMTTQHD